MKLASLKSGRDGALMVVSSDLTSAVLCKELAPTMQAALDEWEMISPQLRDLSRLLNENALDDAFAFDPRDCAAPMPRAYQWALGAAYVTHMELAAMAKGVRMPDRGWTDPVVYHGCSDVMLGACDPIETDDDEGLGVDFEAGLAVIVDDTPMGISPDDARSRIQLITLVNAITLRAMVSDDLAKGVAFFHSKPAVAFAPVCVTPDELGISWDGAKLHLPLHTRVNQLPFGQPNCGMDMTFDFPTLVAHTAETRNVSAGSIIGSGVVSNKLGAGPGQPINRGGDGFSSIAEQRMVETIEQGEPDTPYLAFGDRVEIEMVDANNRNIFGKIDQRVARYDGWRG